MKLILAPMERITNIAFRLLCKKYGVDIVFSEMVNANAVVRNNKSTLKRVITVKEEKPFVIQLFGSKVDVLKKAVKMVKADWVDINFGCPVRKVISQGSGAALLKRPRKIKEIVDEISKIREVSVKMRKCRNLIKICKSIQDNVKMITIHGRTVSQGYSGKADWDIIRKVKEEVNCKVVGNGDVFNEEDCKRMLDYTKCDDVMIGRGAIGNPFIFKRIKYYLKTGKKLDGVKDMDKIKTFFEYYKLAKKYNLDAISSLRIKAMEFTKGIRNSSKLRNDISKCKSYEELKKLL